MHVTDTKMFGSDYLVQYLVNPDLFILEMNNKHFFLGNTQVFQSQVFWERQWQDWLHTLTNIFFVLWNVCGSSEVSICMKCFQVGFPIGAAAFFCMWVSCGCFGLLRRWRAPLANCRYVPFKSQGSLHSCKQITLHILVKPTDYVDPYGALNHLHKILLGSSETLLFRCYWVTKFFFLFVL